MIHCTTFPLLIPNFPRCSFLNLNKLHETHYHFFFPRTAFISSAYLSFKCLLTEERKEHTKTQTPSKKHFKMHLYFSRINLAL